MKWLLILVLMLFQAADAKPIEVICKDKSRVTCELVDLFMLPGGKEYIILESTSGNYAIFGLKLVGDVYEVQKLSKREFRKVRKFMLDTLWP